MEEGRITSVGNFAEAFAGLAGGFIATISLRTPFYFQAFIAASAIPAALFLTEPKFHEIRRINSIKVLVRNIKNTLTNNSNLRIAVLFSALTGTATLTFAWFVQPFLKEIETPVAWFGIIWTLLNLSVGITTMFAYKVERKLGKVKSSILILFLIALGFIFSGVTIIRVGIIFLFLFYLFRGIATPILKNYINIYTESEVRATILSIRNFVIRINFAVIGPALGYITDHLSLKLALIIAGGIYFVAGFIIILPWIKEKF